MNGKLVDLSDDWRAVACKRTKAIGFSEGTPAFYDTFAGMVPCVVIKVFKRAIGFVVSHNEIRIRLTKTVGAYKKGEELTVGAHDCPPKVMRYVRGYSYRINVLYCYVPSGVTP